MGREFRKPWTEKEVMVEVRKVMKKLNIKTMPTEKELHLSGVAGVVGAIYKFGGFRVMREKLNLEVRRRDVGIEVLTKEQREDCIYLRIQGVVYREIADKYDVSISCIVSLVAKYDKEQKQALKDKNKVVTVEDKQLERREQVKAICETVKLQKEKDVEEMKARRIVEIEDCRWKGTFKI